MKINMNNLLGFDKFYEKIKTQNLPIKTSYKLAKINELISTETQFYTNKLSEIIKENAIYEDGELKYNEDRTQILIQPDKIQLCNEQLDELNRFEVDLDIDSYMLSIDELDNVECTAQELQSFIPFIK